MKIKYYYGEGERENRIKRRVLSKEFYILEREGPATARDRETLSLLATNAKRVRKTVKTRYT